MEKIIGYMVTFTTYGTWLQGDKRGYVKDGKVLCKNDVLRAGGFNGRVWTKGFDKRFCFNRSDLTSRIKYVKNHTPV